MTAPAGLSGLRLLAALRLGAGFAGGEGLAVSSGPGGRRTLFAAAEHAPADYAVVDVTDPLQPRVLHHHRLSGAGIRSNNLALFGDLLAVTREVAQPGNQPAGLELFDVSDPEKPRTIGFFDASGGSSRGVHFVWLAEDGLAYLASGAADYRPRDARDRLLLRVVDVSSPHRPREVGRWRLAGLGEGDEEPPPPRPAELLAAALEVELPEGATAERRLELYGATSFDFGYRVHNVTVQPEESTRAYLAYTSAGAFVLDVSDPTRPVELGRLRYSPPLSCAAHTFVPLPGRRHAVLSDETLEEGAADRPQGVWVVDRSVERLPLIVGSLPLPWPAKGEVPAVGRFGPHNLHEHPPGQAANRDFSLIAGAFFGLGVGLYDMSDPLIPRELGRFTPTGEDGERLQLNDVYVDDRGIVYAVDRRSDHCFLLEPV